ncbi:MAG: SDR family NAD(P)-dependent oxidoreductase, partial [Clostridia bacterium]|nr:SDR family NAD(P)-dependent oxidoreductase [Clostridia bacterium]
MKTILVTGAASGIGRAAAAYFAERGYAVLALDILEAPPAPGIRPFRADVTSEAELSSVRDALAAEGVVLDVILSVAGLHRMASFVEGDPEVIRRLLDVNLLGVVLTNRVFHSLLAPRGRIVIVTSEVATYDPLPFNGLYTVSKCALESYAQALRQELALLGQTVVTVRPGAVETPLVGGTVAAAERLECETRLFRREAVHFTRLTARFMGTPMKPERLAPTIFRAA